MMNFEEQADVIRGKGIDDFIEEVKKIPSYGVYKRHVSEDAKETAKFLETILILHSLVDNKFSMLMHSVSTDLLAAMVDMKLRSEILEEK